MTQTIIRIPTTGPVTVARDFVVTPDSLRAEVDGYFEIVRMRPECLGELCALLSITPQQLRTGLPDPDGTRAIVMIVSDSGMLQNLPINPIASVLYGGPFWFSRNANIHGDATIVEID